jgi:large subunit ribosomal protein L9
MASPIQVLLAQDVTHLGQTGDIVRVKPGFARNYLVPRGMAVLATKQNILRIDDLKKAAAAKAEKDLAESKGLAKKLGATPIKLERSVGAENKMYGSVTSKDIHEAYVAKGLEFDRRGIQLEEPIKSLGLAEVVVKVHGDITATLRVEVVKAK